MIGVDCLIHIDATEAGCLLFLLLSVESSWVCLGQSLNGLRVEANTRILFRGICPAGISQYLSFLN